MGDPTRTALERLIDAGDRAYCGLSEFIILLNLQKSCMLPEYKRQRCELLDALAAARAALAEQQGKDARVSLFVDSHIDPEHQGKDRQILHVFYDACMSEGGTADEIHLRGIRAVLAARPAPQPPAEGEVE